MLAAEIGGTTAAEPTRSHAVEAAKKIKVSLPFKPFDSTIYNLCFLGFNYTLPCVKEYPLNEAILPSLCKESLIFYQKNLQST